MRQSASLEIPVEISISRSREVSGPYHDKEGWSLYLEGGTLVIDRDGPLIGTGHDSVFSENGVDWRVHHAKRFEQDYLPVLDIRKIEWDEEMWRSVSRTRTRVA